MGGWAGGLASARQRACCAVGLLWAPLLRGGYVPRQHSAGALPGSQTHARRCLPLAAGALAQYSSAPMGGLLQRYAAACTRPHETYSNEDVSPPGVLAGCLAGSRALAVPAVCKPPRCLAVRWLWRRGLPRLRAL